MYKTDISKALDILFYILPTFPSKMALKFLAWHFTIFALCFTFLLPKSTKTSCVILHFMLTPIPAQNGTKMYNVAFHHPLPAKRNGKHKKPKFVSKFITPASCFPAQRSSMRKTNEAHKCHYLNTGNTCDLLSSFLNEHP